MSSKKKALTRQERANKRARDLGFANDYAFRKHKKAKGIVGIRSRKDRDRKILESLDSPRQLTAARKSGFLAKALGEMGLTYYDKESKSRKPMDKERLERFIRDMQGRDEEVNPYWNLPKSLRKKDDWDKFFLLVKTDFDKENESKARLDALFYIMVLHNGLTVAQFYRQYRDVVVEAGIDDYDEYVDSMIEEMND